MRRKSMPNSQEVTRVLHILNQDPEIRVFHTTSPGGSDEVHVHVKSVPHLVTSRKKIRRVLEEMKSSCPPMELPRIATQYECPLQKAVAIVLLEKDEEGPYEQEA
jgi:hypothetical protein